MRTAFRRNLLVYSLLITRQDLPLHKIPELLAKITGTLSSALSSSTQTKQTSSSSSQSSNLTVKTIDRRSQLFKNYTNTVDDDLISVDGILRLCDALVIEPDSYEVLLFCSLCRANTQMYSLTKDEFPFACFHAGRRKLPRRRRMSKPSLKNNLKPLTFDNGKRPPNIPEISPIPRPVSAGSRDLNTGKLHLSDSQIYKFTSNDLIDRGLIGEGNFGIVSQMEHPESGTLMAVKRIRSTVDERCQKQMLNELDIVMRDNTCPFIVQFYGALFKEGDCWICMELMDTSLDRFYKYVYHKLNQLIPESVLAYITYATLQALDYIKTTWKIIHRDVKPSNILVSRRTIKLCDFGISGQLIDSIAKTRDAGCRPYLPPERIDPLRAARDGYDVRSDVWSLGITIYEIATGYFPFREWTSVFDQLQQIIEGPSLQLTVEHLSPDCQDFVNTCLNKDENQRPKYKKLLEHPFVQRAKEAKQAEHTAVYLSEIITGLKENTDTFELYYYLPSNPR